MLIGQTLVSLDGLACQRNKIRLGNMQGWRAACRKAGYFSELVDQSGELLRAGLDLRDGS